MRNRGKELLLHASEKGDISTVKKLIEEKVDVNSTEGSVTAVDLAARNKHLNVVAFLLSQHAVAMHPHKLLLSFNAYDKEDPLFLPALHAFYKKQNELRNKKPPSHPSFLLPEDSYQNLKNYLFAFASTQGEASIVKEFVKNKTDLPSQRMRNAALVRAFRIPNHRTEATEGRMKRVEVIATLLKYDARPDSPRDLMLFLFSECDVLDPLVLFSLQALHNQETKCRQEKNQRANLPEGDYQTIRNHLDITRELAASTAINDISVLGSEIKALPAPIPDIIVSYDSPLDRHRPFKGILTGKMFLLWRAAHRKAIELTAEKKRVI